MSRLLYSDRTEIFKFKDTGLLYAMEEALDYAAELRRQGVRVLPEEVTYHTDEDGNHYFVFWGM